MAAIKQEILDNIKIIFAPNGIDSVEGEYDYPTGQLTFNFSDGDVVSRAFTYKGDGKDSYSVSGFKTLLSEVGGQIIQLYNVKFQPDHLAEFMAEVTE